MLGSPTAKRFVPVSVLNGSQNGSQATVGNVARSARNGGALCARGI